MAVGDKTLNRAQLQCSSSRPSSSYTTTADRFWEMKMLTFRSSSRILLLPIKISSVFNFENTDNFSMDSTAKFPDVRFVISPRKMVQISCKISRSRDNFLHCQHVSEQLIVFSSSGHFLTVNTVVYVYCDNEPVQGWI